MRWNENGFILLKFKKKIFHTDEKRHTDKAFGLLISVPPFIRVKFKMARI
jgi:hypothetical protein